MFHHIFKSKFDALYVAPHLAVTSMILLWQKYANTTKSIKYLLSTWKKNINEEITSHATPHMFVGQDCYQTIEKKKKFVTRAFFYLTACINRTMVGIG